MPGIIARNYGNSYLNSLKKDDSPPPLTGQPRILSLKANQVLTARNENQLPNGTSTSHTGDSGIVGNGYKSKKFNPVEKASSNIFTSSLSEFQKCPECDIVRRTSLDDWLSHLGAHHPVPSSWPSDRASSLEEGKQQHPYTSVVDSHKKRKNDSIPRPLNSFMIFAQYIRRLVLHSFPDAHNVHISQRIGELWRNMSAVLQASFREEASKLAELHAIEFPHYRYQPKKRNRSDSLIQTMPFSMNKNPATEQNNENSIAGSGARQPQQGGNRSWYYASENASKWFVDKQMQQCQKTGANIFSKRAEEKQRFLAAAAAANNTDKMMSNSPSILNHNRRPRILIYRNNNSANTATSAYNNNKTSERESYGESLEKRSQEDNCQSNKVVSFDAPLTALISNASTGTKKKSQNSTAQNNNNNVPIQSSNGSIKQALHISTNSQDSFTNKQEYLSNYSLDFTPTMLGTSPPEVFLDDSNHFLNYNFKQEMNDYGRDSLDEYNHNAHPTGSSSTIECDSITDTLMLKEDMLSPLQSPFIENQNSCFSDIDLLEHSNLNEIPKANLFSMKVDEHF